MKKKGQAMIFGIMLFMLAFIVAVVITAPLRELVDTARDTDHLNCTSENLTMGTASSCVIMDLSIPALLVTIILVGLGLITYEKI